MSTVKEMLNTMLTPKMKREANRLISIVLLEPNKTLETLEAWHMINDWIKLYADDKKKKQWADIKEKHYHRLYNTEKYYNKQQHNDNAGKEQL